MVKYDTKIIECEKNQDSRDRKIDKYQLGVISSYLSSSSRTWNLEIGNLVLIYTPKMKLGSEPERHPTRDIMAPF